MCRHEHVRVCRMAGHGWGRVLAWARVCRMAVSGWGCCVCMSMVVCVGWQEVSGAVYTCRMAGGGWGRV